MLVRGDFELFENGAKNFNFEIFLVVVTKLNFWKMTWKIKFEIVIQFKIESFFINLIGNWIVEISILEKLNRRRVNGIQMYNSTED